MKVYILTKVNGYAQLESLTPFADKSEAKKELLRQYDECSNDRDYDFSFVGDNKTHAELSASGSTEFDYSWDITEIETDVL